MDFITSVRRKVEWRLLLLFAFSAISAGVSAQSVRIYANAITNQDRVDNAANAIDGNLATRARIRASSGLIAGIGAYSGTLELKFPTTLPANTTSYVKINTDDNLLPALLGGSLGGLLSDVLGGVLIGNQEFTVQARNGTAVVLEGQSQISSTFATPRLRVLVNASNEYFLALTPALAYDRIKLDNRLGSLVGLNNIKRLDVYEAFYIGTPDVCGGATFTSFEGSGISLDLLGLGGAGVTNPHFAIDANQNNFSRLSLGVLAVGASIEQTLYFDGLSATTDEYFIRLRVDPSLLALGVANNIQILAYNGPALVQGVSLNALLNLDLLTLLQGNQAVRIPFIPNAAVNRITVRYNSLLNVQLTQSLDLYGITRGPARPTVSDPFTQNARVCAGSTASLLANSTPGTELVWYTQPTGGASVAVTASGASFVTPALTANTSYYVSARRTGCTEESVRIRIHVAVVNLPVASDISIGSPLSACNGNVTLSPSASIGGAIFKYYKDQLKTQEITTGFAGDSGVTYVKNDTTGSLTISGLSAANSPYQYFISITVEGLCENAANTLQAVVVNYASVLVLQTQPALTGCNTVDLSDAIVNLDPSGDIQYHFYDSNNVELTAEAAANITASGTFAIQAESLSGSCLSALQQVVVTVSPQPVLNIPANALVVNLGSPVTLNATSDAPITWFDPQGNALPSNTFGPFTAAGTYVFTAVASNGNCSSSGSISVTVIDPANCPPLTERVYAQTQSWGSIVTGGVANAANAVDGNPQTFSTVTTGLGLLGVGTTWQTMQWNNTIASGTPVTLKLGSEYSGLILAGAYSVVGTKRNGAGVPVPVGALQPVSGSLLNLLSGESTFEFTFVPADGTGPKAYDGVRIVVGSLLSLAQNVRVYEAYYDRQVTQLACSDQDVEDVFFGAVDLGIGAATATVGVANAFNAVDDNVTTFATMFTGAGVLAAADLTVSFRTPSLAGDSVEIILSRPSTIIDLGLLSGFSIQLFNGSAPVGALIDNNSALLSLSLLGGGNARVVIAPQTVVFDRLRIRFGGVATVLDQVRVHEVRRFANTSVIGGDATNTINACQGQTITLAATPEPCTTFVWYDAEAGGNVVSTGATFTVPQNLAAGTYTYYVQAVRYGCNIFDRGIVTVIVGQTAAPTAIAAVTLNGGTTTTFCDTTAVVLNATLDATANISNPIFYWYSFDGTTQTLVAGETSATLTLTGLAAGTYTYYVGLSSDAFCPTAEADRDMVTFTILPSSQATDVTISDVLVCLGTDAVLTPTSTLANPVFTYYFTNDTTQPIVSGSVVGGATYTVSGAGVLTISGLTLANSPYTYYVGLTSDASCINQAGNLTAVQVVVNDSGTPTTTNTTQTFCAAVNPTVANIQVNEPSVVFYTAETGGTPLDATTPLTNGSVYYAAFDAGTGCGSANRLAITVNINDVATPTTQDDTQDFCAIDNPTVANIQVNEAGVNWYLTPTGGTALATTDALLDGTTYYASIADGIGCESTIRLAVAVTINDADAPTTNSNSQSFCQSGNPAIANIQVNETGVIWYDSPTGGTPLAANTSLTDGTTYYAAIIDPVSGCESATRLSVTITINNIGAPTTANANPDFCALDNATIADLQVNQTDVLWYASATMGTALALDTPLVNGTTYYASQFDAVTGCESGERLAVTVNIIDPATPTTSNTTQGFCIADNATVADLQVNEANVIWYNAATGGTPLAANTPLVDGSTYYAVQADPTSGCESSVRLAVLVQINDSGTPTTTNTTQTFCQAVNPTIANLQVNETGVIFYDAASNGTILPATTALTSGTVYYASFDPASGCASGLRLAITATVISVPSPTTMDDSQEFCAVNNPTVADIQVNEAGVVFYDAATGGNVIPAGTPLTSTSYYATIIDVLSGCESGERLAVTVNIIDPATPTTSNTTQSFCIADNATVADLQVNEANVVWYNAATGGTPLTANTPLVDGGTYYAVQADPTSGCESSVRLAILVQINDSGTPTTTNTTQTFCQAVNPTIANLQVNETGVIFYDAASNGTILPATTPLTSGTVYYASFDPASGCASGLRLAITATVISVPSPTTLNDSQEFCLINNPTVADIQVNEAGVVFYDAATGGNVIPAGTPLTSSTYYAAIIDPVSGCESSVRLAVTVSFNGELPATLTGGLDTECVWVEVTYTTEAGMTNYSWVVSPNAQITAGGQSTDNTITVMWTAVGSGSVMVSYENPCSGVTSATKTVTLTSCSDLTITKVVDNLTPMIQSNVTFTITVQNIGTGSFRDVEVSESLQSGYAFVSGTASLGTYNNLSGTWNIAVLEAGQTATLTIVATVLPTGSYANIASIITSNPDDIDVGNNGVEVWTNPICLTVYNEFSPNNDGANELFRIDCIENYPDNQLEVYNRYGALVYTKRGYRNDWDGTANVSGALNKDEKLPTGTYYYTLDLGNGIKKAGWVAISR